MLEGHLDMIVLAAMADGPAPGYIGGLSGEKAHAPARTHR